MANKLNGWVLIHRQMMLNAEYFSEPFCRNMAWIDLLLLANHKDDSFRGRNNIRVDVKRGQVGYSLESLAQRWKWSRGKAERFLNELEIGGQVVRQKSNVTTLITILNYDTYQKVGKTDDTTDGKTNGQETVRPTDTNKESKRIIKKEKKVVRKRKVVEPVSPLLIEFAFEGDEFKKTYLEFLKMLSLKNKEATEPTIIQHMLFLKGFGEEKAIETIKYSLNGGYPSLYEPKEKNGTKKGNSNSSATTRSVEALLSGNDE